MRGWNTIWRATSAIIGSSGRRFVSSSAITSGTTENRKTLSKQKIRATGAAAAGPNVASASPGPM